MSYFDKVFEKSNTNKTNPVDPAGPDCYRIGTKPCE